MRAIPVYSYDGELVQWIDQKRFKRLTSPGRIARVVKNRNAEIRRVILRWMPGDPKPSLLSDYRGTKYSFRQHLMDGHICHRLRALGDLPRADEYYLAPDEVRPIFLRVLMGCLVGV